MEDSGPIGSVTRWASLEEDWANVGNTPFRRYKNDSYEGGTATPFIVHWPGVVEPGSTTDYVGKFVDVMPTLIDVTGASYPDTYKGDSVAAMQGRSLLPILEGEERRREGPIFNAWAGGKSVYRDGWKLVQDRDTSRWELYHLREDRTETTNRAGERPSLVDTLRARWRKWYERTEPYRTAE